MNTRELVEKAQHNGGFKSLRDMAKAMGLNNSSLSLLASGKGELSDETYIKLAELAGVDPAEVILEKHMRKAGPRATAVWAKAKRGLEALKGGITNLRIMAIMLNMSCISLTALTILLILALYHPGQRQHHANPAT